MVAESVEEWEDDDVASLVGEPFQYDEYEPVSDVEEVLDINQSDSEVDTVSLASEMCKISLNYYGCNLC